MSFDDQPDLQDAVIALRGLREEDRAALFEAARDPETWAGHPAKDRYRREVFDPYFDLLRTMGGSVVVILRETGEIIGCSRYYTRPDAPRDIGIGFTFLNYHYWGGAMNLRLKRLMLGHAFQHFDRVWFHIAPDNIRSQKATAKLGAVAVDEMELDLGTGVAPWKRMVLDRAVWGQVSG